MHCPPEKIRERGEMPFTAENAENAEGISRRLSVYRLRLFKRVDTAGRSACVIARAVKPRTLHFSAFSVFSAVISSFRRSRRSRRSRRWKAVLGGRKQLDRKSVV